MVVRTACLLALLAAPLAWSQPAAQAPSRFDALAAEERRRAGDPDYDLALGAAALDAGRLERALIALERFVARRPESEPGHAALAQVYLRMGSLDLAAQEFRWLATRGNPAHRAAAEATIAEIERAKARRRLGLKGFVEAGGGRDSNLSAATRDFSGAVLGSFGLPGIAPTGNSIRRADNFASLAADADLAYAVADDRVAFAMGDVRWRGYRREHDFDQLLAEVAAGYQDRRGLVEWTAAGFVQAFRQDGAAVDFDGSRIRNDRNAVGASLELRRPLNTQWQAALGLQAASLRYPSNATQDTRQYVVSLAAEHRPGWWSDGVLVAKAHYARDDARRPLNAFLDDTSASRHAYGLRLAAVSESTDPWSCQGAVGWTRRVDDDAFARATLVAQGRDDLFEASLACGWRLGGGWSLHPVADYAYNRSNIALYTYRKAEGGLRLRREFR